MAIICSPAPGQADWKDDIGFTRLQVRLGAAMPTGAGVRVAQIEMPVGVGAGYLPDITNAQFAGKAIYALSGGTGVSSHATMVSQYYFGSSSSVGNGIALVEVYNSDDWLQEGFLNLNSATPPLVETARVENHSWVGSFGIDQVDEDTLSRLDLVVQRDGVLTAAGVDNSATKPMPRLMCSGYNAIAVGLSNGQSSTGPTTLGPAGRVKPDLVVPMGATSWAAPVVASCGSLLTEAMLTRADLRGAPPSATPLLVKALLMGGCDKTPWLDWRRGFVDPSTDGAVPLDYRYGAGQLDIDNSFRMLAAGQQKASAVSEVLTTGWDYDTVLPTTPQRYFFTIPASSRADSVSILVTWHRRVATSPGVPMKMTLSLADIDLRLYEASGFAIGAQVDQSISRIDNVEHIFGRSLLAGRYAFEVNTDMAWEYAVTWDIHLLATAPADFDGDGHVDGADLAIFDSCRTGPSLLYDPQHLDSNCRLTPDLGGHLAADFDRDGDVDQTDFAVCQRCFSGPNQPVNPGCAD